MKKSKILFLVALALTTLVMTGCVGKKVTGGGAKAPVLTDVVKDITLNYDQIRSDCRDGMYEDDSFEYLDYIDCAVDEENKIVELIIPITDDAPQSVAKDYGKAYIRMFNDACVTQDGQYTLSQPDNYGSYWDTHDIYLIVFRSGDIFDHDKYLVAQHIPAGSNAPIEYYTPGETEPDFLENFGSFGMEEETEEIDPALEELKKEYPDDYAE